MSILQSLFTTPVNLNEFLTPFDLKKAKIILSINKDEYDGNLMNKTLIIEQRKKAQLVITGENSEVLVVNKKTISKPESEQIQESYKLFDHVLFQLIEMAKEINTPLSEIESEVTQEQRGLEWLKVSIQVLKEALKNIKENPNYIFQGRIFWIPGEFQTLRIQCLSLDFILEFFEDHRLRVRAWNYKDGIKTSKDNEDMIAEFVHLKGPILDEFIHLFNEMRPYIARPS